MELYKGNRGMIDEKMMRIAVDADEQMMQKQGVPNVELPNCIKELHSRI